MVTLATGKSRIYVERSCVDRRRGLLCANFLLGIFVKRSRGLHLRVGWSPSRGGGGGIERLSAGRQPAAPQC